MKGIIGKKMGMTHIFNGAGVRVPVTVVSSEPCTVLAVRTVEKDGYSAVQLGYGRRSVKRVSKAVRGHLVASGIHDTPPSHIFEFRTEDDHSVGDKISVSQFDEGDFIDVTGVVKGRGFQGVVRRYRFKGGRASHGGAWTRRPGSIGMCEHPGKVQKGRKMPGQMGNNQQTVQNLQVVGIRSDDNLLLIKGSVPGARDGILLIRSACKK